MILDREDAELICGTTSTNIFQDIMKRRPVLVEVMKNFQEIRCNANPPCSIETGCPIGDPNLHIVCFMRWIRNIMQGDPEKVILLLTVFENLPNTYDRIAIALDVVLQKARPKETTNEKSFFQSFCAWISEKFHRL